MSGRAEIAPAARQDLTEIWDYIAADNPDAAEKYENEEDNPPDVILMLRGSDGQNAREHYIHGKVQLAEKYTVGEAS